LCTSGFEYRIKRLTKQKNNIYSIQKEAFVAEWLSLLILNHLSLTAVGWNPNRDIGFYHVRKLSR
jgi:hypothetical protein